SHLLPVMDIVLRAIAVFAFLYLLMRLMGRRELSSLEPFDLILLIILGGAVLAVGTIGVLQLATSYTSFKFPRLRPWIDGEPIIVVQDGKPIERNLARERITIDDLAEAARREGIGSMDEVAWAVMETSGSISFIKKSG